MALTSPQLPARNTSASLPSSRSGNIGTHLARALAAWHLASLDAPTVAIVWSIAFPWAAKLRVPMGMLAIQALAVWSVYVCDRLLDARSAIGHHAPDQLRERHFFHWRHRRILVPLAAIAACAAAVLVLARMPVSVRVQSAILAAATLGYFGWVHRVRRGQPGRLLARVGLKELLVGVLFAAGCALPLMDQVPSGPSLIVIGFFALLAWLNCRAIDRWEAERALIKPFRAAWILTATGMLLAAATAAHQRISLLLVAGALSAGMLALLDRQRKRMNPVTLRAAADLTLLTPILLYPIAAVLRMR